MALNHWLTIVVTPGATVHILRLRRPLMPEATIRFLENACFIAADWHWTGYLTCYDPPLLRNFSLSLLAFAVGSLTLFAMVWRDRERLLTGRA
jgi:hypothetical protein